MSGKVTNEQKYRTPEERNAAMSKWCVAHGGCNNCDLADLPGDCQFHWLALEADEEKPEPCPFCGGETKVVSGPKTPYTTFAVKCANDHCGYLSCIKTEKEWAVAAHNRVARAVRAANGGEVK